MRKRRDLILKTETDIKVFLLFLLDNIGYPVEYEVLLSIVEENTDDISLDYVECLERLVESGHIELDMLDKDRYYSITSKGRMVASELYDTIDKGFRERSLRSAIRYISLTDSGRSINAFITETESKRYIVTMQAHDRFGEVMSVSVTVNSREEAEAIKKNYEAKPEGVYRGVLFSVTGKLEYMK
ncbi:MAG: DUF4364 family protein [Clostridia bacterium]|nr:DUF4364 family protein [Clostridia bacterium]